MFMVVGVVWWFFVWLLVVFPWCFWLFLVVCGIFSWLRGWLSILPVRFQLVSGVGTHAVLLVSKRAKTKTVHLPHTQKRGTHGSWALNAHSLSWTSIPGEWFPEKGKWV